VKGKAFQNLKGKEECQRWNSQRQNVRQGSAKGNGVLHSPLIHLYLMILKILKNTWCNWIFLMEILQELSFDVGGT
jgi:hypothetical protein